MKVSRNPGAQKPGNSLGNNEVLGRMYKSGYSPRRVADEFIDIIGDVFSDEEQYDEMGIPYTDEDYNPPTEKDDQRSLG